MGNSYCNDGGWEDPDESQDYCESCGYDWTGSECCGDDSSESIEDGECVCSAELDDCGECGGDIFEDGTVFENVDAKNEVWQFGVGFMF